MNPALYLPSWPDAIDSVQPRDTARVGWISGHRDDVVPEVAAMIAKEMSAPVDLYLFDEGSVDNEVRRPPIRHCGLRSESAATILFSLDALILSERAAPDWWETLARWAIPPVVLSDKGSNGYGLIVPGEDTKAIANACIALLTDPASRRACLKALRSHRVDGERPTTWRVEGVFDSSYSLAQVNRHLAMALSAAPQRSVALLTYEQGASPDISLEQLALPEQDAVATMWARGKKLEAAPDLSLRNAWPPAVQGMRGYLRVLANYAWEETRFPREFTWAFNRNLDLITVVSSQTARFLEDAGVNVPMAVVGNGADHLAATVGASPRQALPEGFKFLHVSSCFARKGVDVLLAAFGEGFSAQDSVALLIKTFPNPHNNIHQQVADFREAFPDAATITVLEEDWAEDEMVGLYVACDAYVAPSRGEGFGLPLAEAMRHQLPVITSDWGGHRDFCDSSNSWLVPTRLEPAKTHLSKSGSLWAEPDPTALSEIMKEVFNAEPGQLAKKTQIAQRAAERLTWESVVARTERAVERVSERDGPTLATRLGWISSWGTRCGIASYSWHMTAAFQPGGSLDKQCKLTVLAPENDFPEAQDEIYVERCWLRGAITQARALVRRAIMLELDAVVLQHHWSFFSPEILVDSIRALAGAGIPVFLDMHNTRDAPEGIAHDYNLIHGLSQCARVLLHTLDDVSEAEAWGLKDNLTLFPLASYPIEQPSPAKLAQLRDHLALQNKRIIASYGFLMQHKGIIELVESMPDILANEPNAHLLLVNALYSESVSGPVRDEVKRTIARLNLADSVTCIFDYLPDEESMCLLKLADVVVYPYRESTESSSAAVRMAVSGRCTIAITPVHLFADVAPGCITLPGSSPDAISSGVIEILRKNEDAEWRKERSLAINALAEEIDSRELSDRLLGMVQGHIRRLDLR